MKRILFLLIFFKSTVITFGQQISVEQQIDNLVSVKNAKPFNGIILITQNGKKKYSKVIGYSDFEKKVNLKFDDQFVIGSISKQFTAVLALRAFDKNHLELFKPIKNYLPELTQSWADTVTVHHLLTHMHGIVELDKP
jgi:D-alanyl-D-alanine carboxypeptidase